MASAWLNAILLLPTPGAMVAFKTLPSFRDGSTTIGMSALPLMSRW
jgi:hypothetical protein